MKFKNKIIAVAICGLVTGFGIFSINVVQAQTETRIATANSPLSIDQLQQIVKNLTRQIQQIVQLIAQLKPLETCGNSICRFGETAATCSADCGNPQSRCATPPIPACVNGTISAGKDKNGCIVRNCTVSTTKSMDAKDYQLSYKGNDLFTVDGPMTVTEILNCSLPDPSIKCPETAFIGKEDCDKTTYAPSDCAHKGTVVENGNACIYEGFSSGAAGTIVTGYYGLAIRDNRCFLIGWALLHHNCDNYDNPTNCHAEETQRIINNKQMLSDFKINETQK